MACAKTVAQVVLLVAALISLACGTARADYTPAEQTYLSLLRNPSSGGDPYSVTDTIPATTLTDSAALSLGHQICPEARAQIAPLQQKLENQGASPANAHKEAETAVVLDYNLSPITGLTGPQSEWLVVVALAHLRC